MSDFQWRINEIVLFNSLISEEEKEEIKGLILETCQRIETKNPQEILNIWVEIEFIIHKPVPLDHAWATNSPDGGSARKSFSQNSLFVTYFPNPQRFTQRDSKLYILAHEFGHVFHKHPNIDLPADLTERQKIRDQFELEADKKAVEWGFRPHETEVQLFPTYQKHCSLGLLDC